MTSGRSRRIGLTKDYTGGAPVTVTKRKTINGVNLRNSSKNLDSKPFADNENAPPPEDNDIFAPPKDSDDEDDYLRRPIDSDSDFDGSITRGDIPQSSLSKHIAASKHSSRLPAKKLSIQPENPLRNKRELTTSSEAHNGSPPLRRSRRAGRASSESPPKKAKTEDTTSSAPMNIFGGYIKSSSSQKSARTYGSAPNKSKIKATKSENIKGDSSPVLKLKQPPEVPSLPSTPEKLFKVTDTDQTISTHDYIPAFKVRDISDLLSSPASEPRKLRTFEGLGSPSLKPVGSPEFQAQDIDNSLKDEEDDELSRLLGPEPLYLQHRVLQNLEASQAPIFKLPSMVENILQTESTQLDEGVVQAATVDLDNTLVDDLSPLPEAILTTICPMCGENVDRDYLEGYHIGRMNIRMQANFCRDHRKRTAEQVWITRGYPTIKWEDLDSRIEQHHRYLKELLDGASSYYRNILDEAVKSGKDRTLKQAMLTSGDSLTPGYYGSRGQRAMSENIMKKFSPALRRIAVKDRLVSARGVTGYVQAVMVPELAILLIKEDMAVQTEEAREIMRDSIVLGDLVNEEEEDVITKGLSDAEE